MLRTRDQLALLRDGMSREDVLAEFARSHYSRYPWFGSDGVVRGTTTLRQEGQRYSYCLP